IGHRFENVASADIVVFSSTIEADNPELIETRALGTPIIARAEILAELMRLKYGIALTGSHNKTTTTSLVTTVLHTTELDPTIVVNGKITTLGSTTRLGADDLLVTKTD